MDVLYSDAGETDEIAIGSLLLNSVGFYHVRILARDSLLDSLWIPS